MSDSKIKRAHDLGLDWVTADIWPTIGLCEAIAADRGELMADQMEYLQGQRGISLETPGPYKAVFRPIGERYFGIVQGGFKGQVDGVVVGSNVKKRGDLDYVENANMSLASFERILIALIVHHNQFGDLKRTDLPATYPDEVALKPLNIWQWGQENCTGYM
ncbi:transposase, partial [Pseudoalteromonas sp. Angola-7]|nr:transposase [Pseudoalteromonas sp. Angola-7]